MSEHLKAGVHELLRYVLPGYSFLFVLLLPFILTGVYEPLFDSWERFAVPFLVSGFVIGYFLYYPYYRLFIRLFYYEDNRLSLKKARLLLNRRSVDEDVRALHSIAYYRTKDKDARYACLFQFSVFHSLGVTALSISSAYLLSVFVTLLKFLDYKELLIFEAIMALLLPLFLWILYSEYIYRFRLAVRMEDYLVMQKLEEVVKETESARNIFQQLLPEKRRNKP